MTDDPTEVFLSYRELLFSVVYNMLGSVADTEDALQDVWLSWAARAARGEPIDNTRAYLTRAAINQALAKRTALSRRRETYVGQWLPEPLLDADPVADGETAALHNEAFSMALLVVLETLSPLERAAFVLHEAFGFAHNEIAEILDRSPAAVRQLVHRSRAHVRARRPRHSADPAVRHEVTERFARAALGGDLAALLEILAPDVTLWTDGGGKGPAVSLHPVHGREAVAAVFVAVASRATREFAIRYRFVNGDPSALVFDDDAPVAVVVIEPTADGTQVREVYSVTNPDKLLRL